MAPSRSAPAAVSRTVGVAVAAVVEPVAVRASRGGGDRAGAAERGERAVVAHAFDVSAGGDEQLAGVAGGDREQARGARRRGGDQRCERGVELGDLAVELGDAATDRAQRKLGGLLGLVQAAGVGDVGAGRAWRGPWSSCACEGVGADRRGR